jgi:AAA domain-containing protein
VSEFRLLDVEALLKSGNATWLVDGLLPARGLTFLVGRFGAGKTFVALDLALHLSSSLNRWHGRKLGPANVFYAYSEGLLKSRVAAWRKHHDPEEWPASTTFAAGAMNLLDPSSVERFLRLAKEEHPGLIVLETFSSMTAGADENDSKTAGQAIEALHYIEKETGAAVLVTHHTPLDPRNQRIRGHSRLGDGADTILLLENAKGALTLRTLKQREADAGDPIHLQLVKEDGSLVVAQTAPPTSRGAGTTKERSELLERMGADKWKVLALAKALNWSKSKTRDRLEEAFAAGDVEREVGGPRGAMTYFAAAATEEANGQTRPTDVCLTVGDHVT